MTTWYDSSGEVLGDDMLGDDASGWEAAGDDMSGADPYMLGYEMGLAESMGLRRRGPARRPAPRRAPARRPGPPQFGPQLRAPQSFGRPPMGAPLTMPVPWRKTQLAPGVLAPFEGTFILPLVPAVNDGVFTNAISNINFTAQPQKPFRGERLVATIQRSAGAQGVAIRSQQLSVGTDLQQASAGSFSLDVFTQTAFDVRLSLSASQPGILITLPVFALPTVPVGESVVVTVQILGKVIA